MKHLGCFSNNKNNKFIVDKTEFTIIAEGHLFYNYNLFKTRKQYLNEVSKIIGDGKCIPRDGRTIQYLQEISIKNVSFASKAIRFDYPLNSSPILL